MDFPIITIWMSPLSFLGVLGVIFIFLISFFDEIPPSKQNSPRCDAAERPITGTPGLNVNILRFWNRILLEGPELKISIVVSSGLIVTLFSTLRAHMHY